MATFPRSQVPLGFDYSQLTPAQTALCLAGLGRCVAVAWTATALHAWIANRRLVLYRVGNRSGDLALVGLQGETTYRLLAQTDFPNSQLLWFVSAVQWAPLTSPVMAAVPSGLVPVH